MNSTEERADILWSNNGKGPYCARIVNHDLDRNGVAWLYLERWHKDRPERTASFRLRAAFMQSPSCGWKARLT